MFSKKEANSLTNVFKKNHYRALTFFKNCMQSKRDLGLQKEEIEIPLESKINGFKLINYE